MLVLPVVMVQALVAPIRLRYHCWLDIGSLGMSPGGGGDGALYKPIRFRILHYAVRISAPSFPVACGGEIGSIVPFGSTATTAVSARYASSPSPTLIPTGKRTCCQPIWLKLRLTMLPMVAFPV